MFRLSRPLTPLDGAQVLVVLIIARISTARQDRRSLEEQTSLCEKCIRANYSGKIRFVKIASQGSGEILDRKELLEAIAYVDNREVHVVVVEDCSRLMRRNRVMEFMEACEDQDIRFISVNDGLDTGAKNWRTQGFFASYQNEQHNLMLSERIKERLRERFLGGGAVACAIYGYIRPTKAESDAKIAKDPQAETIYDQWFRKLEDGANYSEVADWLNANGIKPGPISKTDRWNGATVRRVTFNPILKGVRVRNRKESRRINKTGRRRSVDAPEERLLSRPVPHLAFIEPERYDRVIALLIARGDSCPRGRRPQGRHPRRGVSRKRTRWPGQHVRCGICNRIFYWGGHGVTEHMMCSGTREYKCWNAITFDGHDAAKRILKAVAAEIAALPDFDETFRSMLSAKLKERHSIRQCEYERIDKAAADIDRRMEKCLKAIEGDDEPIPELKERINALREEREILRTEREQLDREPSEEVELPPIEVIRERASQAIESIDTASPEFGRAMRKIVTKLAVYPVRLCDGPKIVLRAKATLQLASLANLEHLDSGCRSLLSKELMIDLFDLPQRAAFRERILAMRSTGLTEAEVAQQLGLTVTATQRAAALNRLMRELEIDDPYVPVVSPPEGIRKLSRHRHPRYRFEIAPDDEMKS